MRPLMRKLWNDEIGGIISAEYIMLSGILVAGLVIGLNGVRTAIVSEMDDMANGINGISQSYYYSGVEGPGAMTAGSEYTDTNKCIIVSELDE